MKIISIHRKGICIDLPKDIEMLQLQPLSASDKLTPFTAVALPYRSYNFVCFLDIMADDEFTVQLQHSGLFTITSIATLKVLEVETIKKSLSKEKTSFKKCQLTCQMTYNQNC